MSALIETRGLGWAYAPLTDGGSPVVALSDVDLAVEPGRFVGVVGPTGAGKSTLCMALAGVIPELADGDMAGEVLVAGRSTHDVSVADLSAHVGYVQQDPESQLFCASVEDELAFPLEQRGVDPRLIDRRIDETLALVGMEGMRSRVPTSLSGGQMQRVAIAAALVAEPDILVLDEPTAALDPDGRREVFAVLDRLRAARRLTVVMAEQHTRYLASSCDRIVVLDGGRVLRDADPAVFVREAPLLARLGVAAPEPDPVLRVSDTADETPADPAIRIEGLTHRYAGAAPGEPAALDDVSLTVPRGAFVGLVGRNGSGKTTLARHLNGLLRPTAGRVVVDGIDTADRPVNALAAHVGYAFQNPDHQIFCASTRDEIAFGARSLGRSEAWVDATTERLMETFGLTRFADVSPATLGYGDRRLVALASVLAMDAPILVLDEPTAGLDQRLAARLLDAVDAANAEGTTVVMISHDMHAVAAHCTHLLRLDAGRVAQWGELRSGSRDASPRPADRRETHGR
ncbi:cobalt ABC transporter [Bifidobacterium sp. DSM 109958]|uniref:Cobalt ABC transporter n=1 Tax=Bifidobacterium moraviense TaxID=2675323 RepID=A0A7Y0EZY5_9BIFI|nr:ABC transporter ATP-binding protein [Bifidobacterium sp. DSM 109958]NMM99474.1 cobalt ABC transporter [Bifidobacterium sp. DSM 109958]